MSNTNNMIRYWRNSLADAERMSIDPKKLEDALPISKDSLFSGQVDTQIVEAIFIQAVKNNKQDVSGEKVKSDFISVLVCPIKAMAKVERGMENDTYEQIITPLWIPAIVSKSGYLLPRAERYSWIPRDLLEPNFGKTVTVGNVYEVDEYLTINKQVVKPEEGWNAVLQYSINMFEYVTKQSFDDFKIDDYVVDANSYIIIDSPIQGVAKNIISLYDNIIRDNQMPSLLHRYANMEDEKIITLMNNKDEMNICIKHIGQMGYRYPLSTSQRHSLHHFLTLGNGQILAVNGPPGTGKTTLLQSVIASLWVEAAVNEAEPPVMVAASANNQAVTNIIDSFGKIDESEASLLSGRWLDEINSYGLYCPSKEKIKESKGKFQVASNASNDRGPFPTKVENPEYVYNSTKNFMKRCSEYANEEFLNLESCLKFLHNDLKNTVSKIDEGINLFKKFTEYKQEIVKLYEKYDGIENFIKLQKLKIEELNTNINIIRTVEDGWLKHFSTEHWLMTLFSFLPPVKERIMVRNKLYNNTNYFNIETDLSNKVKILEFIEEKKRKLKSEKDINLTTLEKAECIKNKFEHLSSIFLNWINTSKANWEEKKGEKARDIKIEFNSLYDMLEFVDVNLRYKAFKIATHYWECRWLVQMECQISNNYKETVNKENLQTKWQRYAKLTPCIVSTFYMIPSFFTAWRGKSLPLYDCIDLLIVDEAGQVSPEIAGATFSLAKKAIIVGDLFQIEPVCSINEPIDIANLQRYQIINSDSDREIDSFFNKGMAASKGSVMKIAQRASLYQSYSEERGMFLSEHRRCFNDIIQYCNELAYKGRLQSKRKNEPGMLLPFMGHKNVKGKAVQSGGSWGNKKEADTIAQWISDNKKALEDFHTEKDDKKRKKNIEDIIGVVTPFSYQVLLIKSALKQMKIKGITVGTVHSLQGAERNVIIFSPVYDSSQKGRKFFYDNGVNMLNVAVSRAKDSFLVFGDMDIFDVNSSTPSGILTKYIKTEIS